MVVTAELLSAGSLWHRWEPHIHAPGTVLNDQFAGGDAWEKYLSALEAATPKIHALGITDYYSTTLYERVVKAWQNEGRLPDCQLIFPNIEMRLGIGTVKGSYVNVHLLVRPDDTEHLEQLRRFLTRLTFRAHDDTYACTPADLTRLGRRENPALTDDASALSYGSEQFKVSLEQLETTYRDFGWAHDNIVVAVSGNDDGVGGVRDGADVVMRQNIGKFAHVIFASSPSQRDFWLGRKADHPPQVIKDRYGALKPCLHGCDAHALATVAQPDLSRFSWIKGGVSFDALGQACIEPARAYVGEEPPMGATPSQAIASIRIHDAPWATTPAIALNPGLVAIIGARGSGKTALADMIAAGCDALPERENAQSFLARAGELLSDESVEIAWGDGKELTTRQLVEDPLPFRSRYKRARYLTQQFVDELCSSAGMTDALMGEIERVIFEAHSADDREGASDFSELRSRRASHFRDAREREQNALATVSERIGAEREKMHLVAGLKAQIDEKEKLVARYTADRQRLVGKGTEKRAARLNAVTTAADKVRGYVRYYANQRSSILSVKQDVSDLRNNRAPEDLRRLKDRFGTKLIGDSQWEPFGLTHKGNVDAVVSEKQLDVEQKLASWKGKAPTNPVTIEGAFVADDDDLEKMPLAMLEAEAERLQKLVTVDRQSAEQYATISKRIVDENTNIEKLREKLTDCEAASGRAQSLIGEREAGYRRVFDALLSEENVLRELYAPLSERLSRSQGSLRKMSFSVHRVVDVERWAREGEALFDLRRLGRKPIRPSGRFQRRRFRDSSSERGAWRWDATNSAIWNGRRSSRIFPTSRAACRGSMIGGS